MWTLQCALQFNIQFSIIFEAKQIIKEHFLERDLKHTYMITHNITEFPILLVEIGISSKYLAWKKGHDVP
jgi:hypothetical protein